MCRLATKEVINWCTKHGNGADLYSDQEYHQLNDCLESLLEDDFIDPVFGNNSKIEASEFIKQCSKHDWIFSPTTLRQRIFLKADLDWRY